jgi:hypothetical protein
MLLTSALAEAGDFPYHIFHFSFVIAEHDLPFNAGRVV